MCKKYNNLLFSAVRGFMAFLASKSKYYKLRSKLEDFSTGRLNINYHRYLDLTLFRQGQHFISKQKKVIIIIVLDILLSFLKLKPPHIAAICYLISYSSL